MTRDPEHSIKEDTKSWINITRSYFTRGISVFYHRNAYFDIGYSVKVSCSLNLLNSCDTELSRSSWSLSCAVGIAKAYTQHYSRVCPKSFSLFFSFNRFCRFSLLLHAGNQNFASPDFTRNLIVPSLLGLLG